MRVLILKKAHRAWDAFEGRNGETGRAGEVFEIAYSAGVRAVPASQSVKEVRGVEVIAEEKIAKIVFDEIETVPGIYELEVASVAKKGGGSTTAIASAKFVKPVDLKSLFVDAHGAVPGVVNK